MSSEANQAVGRATIDSGQDYGRVCRQRPGLWCANFIILKVCDSESAKKQCATIASE